MFCFDTHMHFDLYKDRDSIIQYLENTKSYTIAVTNLPDLFEKYIGYYETYKYVKFALGYHPELVSRYNNQMEKFKRLLPATRYIGEVGVDFTTQEKDNQVKQIDCFKQIVAACNEYNNKILTVHSRKAEKEVLDILNNSKSKVILHWFSGSVTRVNEAVEKGYYFSINQQMIKSQNGKRIINQIPIEKILVESDAPFTKGLEKEYSVSFMNDIYKYLSDTRGIGQDELSIILKENFRKVLS